MDFEWDRICQSDWQLELNRAGHCGLRQTWHYGEMMRACGAVVTRCVVRMAGQVVALAQMVARRGLRLISQGPVWVGPLAQSQMRAILRRLARHAAVTVASLHAPLSGFGIIPLITPRTQAIWHIGQPDAALRAGLHGKWRNRLLRAEGAVQPCRLKAPNVIADLIAQEARQRQERGYKTLPGAILAHWQGPRLAIGWRRAGALQAGMIFLIHGQGATYQLGWASPTARAGFAHGPMLWQAALALRDLGVSALDLGDVNTENQASLTRFKLGTGAVPIPRGPTALIVPR